MRISAGALAAVVLPLISLLPACVKTVQPVGPGTAPTPSAPPAASPESGTSVAGLDRESAVLRCGPRDSYAYVASGFRCADGTNPFAGVLRDAARSRLRGGAVRNSRGHMVDIYVVPCPEGPRRVYVDMYGCPEYERKLFRASPPPK